MGTSQLLSVPYALYAGNVVNSGGKTILYLTGDITNAQAQAKIAAEVGSNTQQILIDNCNAITTIDLSMITDAVDIRISDNENLQSINFSKLETCGGLSIDGCPKLSNLNLSQLKQLSHVDLGRTGLTTFALNSLSPSTKLSLDISYNPQLTSISIQNFTKSGDMHISNNDALTSIAMPALQTADYISVDNNYLLNSVNFQSLKLANRSLSFSGNISLTNISFPQLLTTTGSISIYNNDALTSVSFPVLNTIKPYFSASGIQIRGNKNLATIQLPNLTNFTPATNSFNDEFDFSFNKLPSSQINALLNKLVNITPSLTDISIALEGQNPPAPPTGQGITDKATLISNGNTVRTD